ncbi:hypothetical protein L3X38_021357 [Prunus dulcis]|uniref:F-box domain-containing protein n=1 Tax=Prunus dulcis TaxID=3755 RepID=A0AAD4VWF1_PRUDU|nr:hypothetical protein L3X38_021357 [Prunus dulcis]
MMRPRATKRSWSSRISQSKPIGEASDHYQSPLKDQKEILSRLPPKCAAPCMCVSKRWFSLIQSDNNQNSTIARARARAIIISDRRRTTRRSKFLSTSSSEQPDEDEPCERKFFSMSSEPDHQPHEHELSLGFLPCFQTDIVDPYKGEPVVIGADNDLILCCATTYYQRDYYICNPYTKQWDALPLPLDVDLDVDQEDATSAYKVVRINDDKLDFPGVSSEFYLEIFSSETGQWTQGLLGDSIYVFRYIDKPEIESGRFDFLSECGGGGEGCLRMCVFSSTNLDHDDPAHTLGAVSVWELKDDGHGVWDWDWKGHVRVKEAPKGFWC